MRKRPQGPFRATTRCAVALLLAAPAVVAAQDVAADKLAVTETLARYAYAVDTQDADAVTSVFTTDTRLDSPGRVVEGIAQVQDFVRKIPPGFRHFVSDIVTTVSGDTATARSYVMVVDTTKQPPAIRTAGIYEDTLVRAGDIWKIRTRRFMPAPTPAVP
jgi:ketosteroid isomerase-like protein